MQDIGERLSTLAWKLAQDGLYARQDERAYASALAAGDQATIARLDDEARERMGRFDRRGVE